MGFLFTEAQLVSKIMYVSSGKVYYFTWILSFPAMFPSARPYRFQLPPPFTLFVMYSEDRETETAHCNVLSSLQVKFLMMSLLFVLF